jgi:hypothetical protein
VQARSSVDQTQPGRKTTTIALVAECQQGELAGYEAREHFCKRFIGIPARAKAPLQDGGASNSIRYATGGRLKAFGLQVPFSSGGRTTYNRTNQSYGNSHCLDAVCVGATGGRVHIPPGRTLAGCLCESPAVSIARQKRVQCRGLHGNIALFCSVPMVTTTTWETAYPPPPEGRGIHAVILDEKDTGQKWIDF